MKNSQLLEVLQVLDLKERRLLLKFVQSPFHNLRQDVIDLCHYLIQKLEEPSLGNLDKKRISSKIFPDEIYEEKKIRYTMSFLFKSLKSFLAHQEFSANPIQEQLQLTQILKKKGLLKIAETELKKCEQQLEKQALRNIDFHYLQYQVGFEKFNFFSVQKRENFDSSIIPNDKLTRYFIADMLRQSCSALSLRTMTAADYQPDLLKPVLLLVEQKAYTNFPAIAIYYYTYKTFTEDQPEFYFKQLRENIKKYAPLFPNDELLNIYSFATNFCIQQANLGKTDYLQELFSLYQEGLLAKVFIENNILNRFTYKNIVMSGLRQKEFDWVENFIYQYKKYLEKKDREHTVQFNLANLYFYKTDYHKAMDLLVGVTFNDLLNDLAARCLLLKIYFVLNELNALNSLLDSFKNFIYRRKDLGYHKTNYLNLIKFTRRLLNLTRYDSAAVLKLKTNIEATAAVSERTWLMEQIGKY